MKPTTLPKDWIVVTSKSHPNRVYYFNVKNNKTSWEIPVDEPEHGGRGKKRKKNVGEEEIECRPTTPELDVSKKAKPTERPMLRARRSVLPSEEKDAAKQSTSADAASNETPQMRQLREKMLKRQAKGNASRRFKISAPAKVAEEQKPEDPEEKSPSSFGATLKTQNLTPQMRVLLEKMKERKAKTGSPKSPPKSEDPEEAPRASPLRRPRARSTASLGSPVNNLPVKARRTSRRTMNASAVTPSSPGASGIPENASENEVTSTISEIIPGRGTSVQRSPKSPRSPKKPEKNVERSRRLSGTPDKPRTPRLGRSALLKKNLAEERLRTLRNSLGDEIPVVASDSPASASQKLPENARILLHDVSISSGNAKESPPSIYKNAELRMKFLRERLDNKSIYEKRMRGNVTEANTSTREPEIDCNVSNTLDSSDYFCEKMEWEPIEDEKIMQEIEVVRSHINTVEGDSEPREVPENSLDLTDGPSQVNKKKLYIVVDTNVFLSNLSAIEEARDAIFRTHGKPIIVVPWTVFRELDFIKEDKSMTRPESLRAKARQAVRFLNRHFSAKHPQVLGQTPMDVANNRDKFEVECPDDEILQVCLQIRMSSNSVVLLSYDKNLCNKAMIHDVATLGRHDPLEKIDYLHASDARNESFLSQHLRGQEQDPNVLPLFVKELRISEEILDQATEILTSFLTVIVAKEMQNLYHEHWEKYTIIRPPWSVFSVLKCAIKHWIAAVSESFTRRAESLLKELLEAMNKIPDSGRKLSDVSHILEMIYDLLQCVKVDKYTNITSRSGRAIAELRAKCVDATQKLHDEQLQDAIGLQRKEEEARANVAFQQFEEVYAFARDMCGLASEAIGMPCAFPFKKLNPLPTIENIKAMQPDVAANLNRLLQILSTALEELNGLHADHRAVLALYNALSTFMPDQKGQLPREFTPLDVYWCLKIKEPLLRLGLGQLQELSSHFCRMASFRCT